MRLGLTMKTVGWISVLWRIREEFTWYRYCCRPFGGKHTHMAGVKMYRCRGATICLDEPKPVHADGGILRYPKRDDGNLYSQRDKSHCLSKAGKIN